jgi:ABC-2 type transport system permease protein
MKLTIIRNSMTGGRAAWMLVGAIFGLLFAAATVWLTLLDLPNEKVLGDLLAAVFLLWLLGWLIGPLWSGSAVLRADHFALLPVPRRKLAVGLLAAAFVSVTAAVTAIGFLALVTYGARQGVVPALMAVPVAALQLVFVVLLSRVTAALFGVVAASRTGAAITGLLFAAMLVLTQSGWMIIVAIMYSDVLTTGFSGAMTTALRAVPSSWGVVAVDAAGRGDWLLALAAPAGLAALSGLLLLIWSVELGNPRRARVTIRGSANRAPTGRMLHPGPTRAVVGKELRTWWRDPLRTTTATVPIIWALGTVLLPLTFDVRLLLPWAGPALALFAITSAGNLYSQDGTALWQTLTIGTERADVRGRQWAYLIVFAPLTIVLSVGLTWWSGYTWPWPWVAAIVPALLGGGAGLIVYASVFGMVPGPDAHKRPSNPLERADTTGQANVLFWVGMLPAAPAVTVVLLGDRLDLRWLMWAGLPVGVMTGVLVGRLLGTLAIHRLTAHGPDMLQTLRTGRATTITAAARTAGAPGKGGAIEGLYWSLGSILLLPQGLIPLVFIVTGVDVRSWFLAMYLPSAYGIPTAVISMLGGIYLVARALLKRVDNRVRGVESG